MGEVEVVAKGAATLWSHLDTPWAIGSTLLNVVLLTALWRLFGILERVRDKFEGLLTSWLPICQGLTVAVSSLSAQVEKLREDRR